MMQMLPGYTLERLQKTDVDLLFPLYFWYCKQFEKSEKESPAQSETDGEIVYRNGKPYRVRKDADWA